MTAVATPTAVAAAPAQAPLRSRLSEGGVKSFIAHVAGVAGGIVVGLAAAVVLAAVAPHVAAAIALGGFAAGAAYIGGKAGDTYFHWARGEERDARNLGREMRTHFEGMSV